MESSKQMNSLILRDVEKLRDYLDQSDESQEAIHQLNLDLTRTCKFEYAQ